MSFIRKKRPLKPQKKPTCSPCTAIDPPSTQIHPSLNFHLLLPRGECHLMNFYLASGFPDHEIWHIGMRFFLSGSPHKLYRLASVLSYGGVAVEEQGQFAFLKGLALDGLVGFAGDGIAQVVPDGRNTPDIACW